MKRKEMQHQKPGINASLIRLVSLLVILPLCIVIVLLNLQLSSYLTSRIIQNNDAFLSQIATNDDQLIETINYATSMLMINNDCMQNLRIIKADAEVKTYKHYQARNALSRQLREIENAIMNAVDGRIAVLTENGYLITPSNISRSARDYKGEPWYTEAMANGRKVTYSPEISNLFLELSQIIPGEEHQYLYSARSILSYSGNYLGTVASLISVNKIWGSYLRGQPGHFGLFVLDTKGNLQACSRSEDIVQVQSLKILPDVLSLRPGEMKNGTENSLFYNAIRLKNSSQILLFLQSGEEMFSTSRTVSAFLWLVTGMVILLILFTLGSLTRKITAPMSRLVEVMNRHHEGPIPPQDLETPFRETDSFIQSYNQACERVSTLMDNIREETHLREKAYYELLISQISPHFISNTVNSIRYLANEEHASATVEALEALSDILQSVYENTSDLTIIANELHLLNAYVKIMRMRYGYEITYIENIPPELYMCEIPAFTLQPLVENAFIHGVHEKQAGQIIVNAEAMTDMIQISIFNNGNSGNIEKIKNALSDNTRSRSQFTGIGLYNINSRIRILYGDQYGLSVNDHLQSGFEIQVRIPRKEVHLNDESFDR